MIIFETHAQGRMAKGCRPHRRHAPRPGRVDRVSGLPPAPPGAAQAKVVTFTADCPAWISARLDWVVAQVKLEPGAWSKFWTGATRCIT